MPRHRSPVLFTTLAVSALAVACHLNSAPATALGEVSAFRTDRSALTIRFSLLDAQHRETTSDGTLQVTIFQIRRAWSPLSGTWFDKREPLDSIVRTVSASEFRPAEIGDGAARRESIVYRLGPIRFRDLATPPSESRGVVVVVFHTPDARVLTGSDTLLF